MLHGRETEKILRQLKATDGEPDRTILRASSALPATEAGLVLGDRSKEAQCAGFSAEKGIPERILQRRSLANDLKCTFTEMNFSH